MTLGTHAFVGAAIATLLPQNPALAFMGGFISHFLLDSIPHFDYQILSLHEDDKNRLNNDMKMGKNFFIDLLRIGSDAFIGMALALLLFQNSASFPYVLLVGAFAGMLPDFLQFVYFKIKRQPLTTLQKFHLFIHARSDLNTRPFLGIFLQILTAAIVYLLVFFLHTLY